MRSNSQTKSRKVSIAVLTAVMFLTCFLAMAFANTFTRVDDETLLVSMNDTGWAKMAAQSTRNRSTSKLLVTYHPNGGKGQTQEVPVDPDSEHTVLDQGYTKSYYLFDGWNTRPDGFGTNYYTGQAIKITDNITLYAMWNPKI
jgi:uncharacterized repeat protein (TIGR02543 family)